MIFSVPADAPDDYAALMDWKNKENWREKFNVDEAWVKDFEIVPIINVPGYGDACAPLLCEQFKVGTHKEKDKLTLCKGEAYKKGFYTGVMTAGPFKGLPVPEAKDKTKAYLVEKGEAMIYYEPEKEVMSRSGCECVVALCDQWLKR